MLGSPTLSFGNLQTARNRNLAWPQLSTGSDGRKNDNTFSVLLKMVVGRSQHYPDRFGVGKTIYHITVCRFWVHDVPPHECFEPRLDGDR